MKGKFFDIFYKDLLFGFFKEDKVFLWEKCYYCFKYLNCFFKILVSVLNWKWVNFVKIYLLFY